MNVLMGGGGIVVVGLGLMVSRGDVGVVDEGASAIAKELRVEAKLVMDISFCSG